MVTHSSSIQRSFRLSARTSALLDEAAATSSESRNALVDRLLGEAVRTERHPLIRFRPGASGWREPFVIGTRLRVRQLVSTVRSHGGDVAATADHLGVSETVVRAAIAYFAEFSEEIDADIERSAHIEAAEHSRWEREQNALA